MASASTARHEHPVYIHELARLVVRSLEHVTAVLAQCDAWGTSRHMGSEPALLERAWDALAGAAKIRNLLLSSKSTFASARSAWLRNRIGIKPDDLNCINAAGKNSVRNGIEHFDERLDEVAECVLEGDVPGAFRRPVPVDFVLPDRAIFEPQVRPLCLRVLIHSERTLVLLDSEIRLEDLSAELKKLRDAITAVDPKLMRAVQGGEGSQLYV